MTKFVGSYMLAEASLAVYEDHKSGCLWVARPYSVQGAEFETWSVESDTVSGAGDMILKINAPLARINQISKKKWLAEIKSSTCGGMPETWLYQSCSTPQDAAQAVIDCYFQNEMVMLKSIET